MGKTGLCGDKNHVTNGLGAWTCQGGVLGQQGGGTHAGIERARTIEGRYPQKKGKGAPPAETRTLFRKKIGCGDPETRGALHRTILLEDKIRAKIGGGTIQGKGGETGLRKKRN